MKPYFEDEAVTIYHGDCRELLPQLEPVDLVLTDPPYGVGAKYGPMYDDSPDGYWEWFLPCVEQLRQAAPIVAFTHRVPALRHISGWDWVGVWSKPYGGGSRIGNSCVLPHWEPIFMFGIHGLGTLSEYMADVMIFNPHGNGSANGKIGRESWQQGDEAPIHHPTPKPPPLFKKLIATLGQNATTVLDPFMGSGTTLRAAKDLGRKAIGIEIEERYCEIAAKRMAQGVLL